MKESKAFPTIYNNATCGNDSLINEVLMFYFQCCAIMVDSDTLSVAAATLANGGLNPLVNPNDPTNTKPQRVLKRNTVKRVLSLMYSCGMYDYSGEFAFRVGLPAKSGVAGGIMVVIPGIMGLATFSPKLDQYGNSARGKEFLLKLTNIYRFHNFDILPHTDSENMGSWNNNVQIQSGSTSMGNTQQQQSTAVTGQTQVTSESTKNQSGPDNGNTSLFPNKKKSELSPRTTTTTQAQSILANATMSKQIANNINNYTDLSHRIHLIHLASLGDAVSLRRLRLSGIEDFHVTDTDLRTPLHLASVNGHVNVVKFLLVQQHPVNVLDRWNVTPLDEAKREGHKSVIQLLKAAGGVEEYYEYINSSSGLLGLGDSSGGVSITIGPGGNISGPSSENLTGIMSTKSVSINVQSPKFNSKNTNKSGIRKKKNLINGDLDVTEVIRGAKSENLGAGNYKSFRNINMTNR